MTVTTTKAEALSGALSLLWQANVALVDGPEDRLLDELGREVVELARKVESYRHAELNRRVVA